MTSDSLSVAGVRTRFALSCSRKNLGAFGLQVGEVLISGKKMCCSRVLKAPRAVFRIDRVSIVRTTSAVWGCAQEIADRARLTLMKADSRSLRHTMCPVLCDVRRASRSCNCRLNPTPVSFALTGNYILVRSSAPNSVCFSNQNFWFSARASCATQCAPFPTSRKAREPKLAITG